MRLFTDVLRDHRNGKLVDHLTEKLNQLTLKVLETGKPGEIVLKIKVGKAKGEDDAFELTPNVKLTLPERDMAKALFYPTEQGDLLRTNPNQAMFDRDDLGGGRPNAAGVKPV